MSDGAHVPTDYISTCLGHRVYITFFMSAAAHVVTDDISTCLGFRVYTKFFLFDAAGLDYVFHVGFCSCCYCLRFSMRRV